MGRGCSFCGGPYFARGYCERCLKRVNRGEPLTVHPRFGEAPRLHVTNYDARGGWCRGPSGKIEEVVPARGMNQSYGELESLVLQASDDIGGGKTERDIEIF